MLFRSTATVQTISEAHLLPVIEQMLEQFPFEILGFHADNGSEYVVGPAKSAVTPIRQIPA